MGHVQDTWYRTIVDAATGKRIREKTGLHGKGQRYRVRYLDPDLPSIQLNAETLQAALVNLVKNAIEAMPDGGQLTARTRITRQGVALDLIDTGVGMDERTAMKMFDAFYTTKSGGSGLGLPTARRIIEAHGARISVHSDVGIGTQFTLEFPTPARIGGDGSAEFGVRSAK